MNRIFRSIVLQETVMILLIVAISGIISLALVVHFSPVLSADIEISYEVQHQKAGLLPPLMSFTNFFGDFWAAIFGVIAMVMIFLVIDYKREAFFLLLTLPADGINFLIKLLVNRPRPEAGLVEVYQKLYDPSFPSGHVVHYVVFFGLISVAMFRMHRLSSLIRAVICGVSLSLIFLVSISRIYVGVHWATDVVAGYLVGFVMLFVILYLYLRPGKEAKEEPIPTPQTLV